MTLEKWLQAIPKAELHVHLEGSVSVDTLIDFAAKHGVALPRADVEDLYRFDDLGELLEMIGVVCDAMRAPADFYRATYELLRHSAASGARYVEFFFSPSAHPGLAYATMLDAILAGARDAERDAGVAARVIPAHNRERGHEAGMAFLDDVLGARRANVLGIGMDYMENDPRPFDAMYRRAAEAGLRRTAHAGEVGPADYVRWSLDVLGCERIDHGYCAIEDPELVARCREHGTVFNVCPTTTTFTTKWRDLRAPDHAIRRMIEAGLAVTLSTDDPGLMRTSLVDEYRAVAEFTDVATLGEIALNGIRASWLDAATKAALLVEWRHEIAQLTRSLETVP